MKLGRCLIGLLLCALASGCTIKLAYNNLDRLVRWQVADYVDLNDAQAAYFDAELAALLYWHRTTHLPRYAARAQSMAAGLDETVSDADLQQLFDDALAWADEVEARGLPMTIEIMASLTDEQVAALPEAFARSNEEFAEDELDRTLPEAQKEWRSRVTDGFKFFTGRLTREQRDFIAAQSVRYQPEYVLWADFRKRWQSAFLEALAKRGDMEAFGAAYRKLVDERESFWGEEFTRVTRANESLGREVLLGVLTRLNDKQTERFQERLLSLAQDFEELAAEAEAPEPSNACLMTC